MQAKHLQTPFVVEKKNYIYVAMGQNLRYLFSRDYHLFQRLFKDLFLMRELVQPLCIAKDQVVVKRCDGRVLGAGWRRGGMLRDTGAGFAQGVFYYYYFF